MRARRKSEHKTAIREQAKRKIAGVSKYDLASQADNREKIAQGLRELRRVSSEGGDSKVKKVKNELTYLLNNYLPTYDNRIEQLIDEWRRSGDLSYDASIRTRLRRARREHMAKSHPL